MAVDVQGEVEWGATGDAGIPLRVVAATGNGVHLVPARAQRRAQPPHLDAQTAKRWLVVVAHEGDAGHRWQAAHHTVVLPATVARPSVVPQRRQGWPPRPYTCSRSWLLPLAFQRSR